MCILGWGIFSDPATENMASIIYVHTYIMTYLIFIGTFVFWHTIAIIRKFLFIINYPRGRLDIRRRVFLFKTARTLSHDSVTELLWTCIPAIILAIIAIPSFNLLYTADMLGDVDMSIKIIGHQWYWTYQFTGEGLTWLVKNELIDESYLNNKNYISYNSNMLTEDALEEGQFRLLSVDNALYLPEETPIKLLITSQDVLHSWAVPSFGIKMDACPARLNQTYLYVFRTGTYFGQCSELCGVNHAFMPIEVTVLSK